MKATQKQSQLIKAVLNSITSIDQDDLISKDNYNFIFEYFDFSNSITVVQVHKKVIEIYNLIKVMK